MSISIRPVGADGTPPQSSAIVSHTTIAKAPTDAPKVPIAKEPAVKEPAVKEPAAKADGKAEDETALNASQIPQALEDINKMLDSWSVSIQFEVDPSYKDVIVKVVDQDTHKVLLQIPSEDVVRIAKAMDRLKGLLVEQTA